MVRYQGLKYSDVIQAPPSLFKLLAISYVESGRPRVHFRKV